MAERLDISEEIVRFGTHLQTCRRPVTGERLANGDFPVQELNREANTMLLSATTPVSATL